MGLLHYEVFTTRERWEKLISCKVVYEDFNYFWQMMNEVAAPVV